MTLGLHDHRTFRHCPPFILPQEIDWSVAVAAPFPIPIWYHKFITASFLELYVQITETLADDSVIKVGNPDDDDHYATATIPDTTAAGVIYRLTALDDILPGEIVEVTYTAHAAAGKGRVFANIGEALYEG